MSLTLIVHPQLLAVCRLPAAAPLPSWALTSPFFSLTRTAAELSIVCLQASVPAAVTAERDWQAIEVLGPLDFSLTGILAQLATPLAAAKISIFALSTYDTDYLLVKSETLTAACAALQAAGHIIKP